MITLKKAVHLICKMAESARFLTDINNNNNKGYSMKVSCSSKTQHLPKKFVLRLPPNVHEKIFLTAKEHRRSMNAEIIHHLERALPSSLASDMKPSDAITSEDQYLSLLRTLPTRKRNALFALLEIDAGTVDAL
jgi:hypothetical protein